MKMYSLRGISYDLQRQASCRICKILQYRMCRKLYKNFELMMS